MWINNFLSLFNYYIFGNIAVLIESNKDSTLSNRKTRPYQAEGDYIQLTLLPSQALSLGRESLYKQNGGLSEAQRLVCSNSCKWRAKSLGGDGGCNQGALALFNRADKLLKSRSQNTFYHPTIRVSVWGDVGRLNVEGLDFVWKLLDGNDPSRNLAYISAFKGVNFQHLALASCQTSQHVIEALSLGYKVYASTIEAYQELQKSTNEPVYFCQVDNHGRSSYGCTRCPIKCNGLRHVVSHNVVEALGKSK